MAGRALTNQGARFFVLKAVCATAEGSAAWAADGPAAAILFRDMARFSVLGGRPGLPRSLGSVYAMNVLLCLGPRFRAKEQRKIDFSDIQPNGIAVTNDGAMLLVSFYAIGTSGIRVYRAADGMLVRTIGSYGYWPLQFSYPCQVFVSSDDFVFVADCLNHRVQVLTPHFDFSSIVGCGRLLNPAGVCADADIIAVSDCQDACVSVFRRADGALLRRLGALHHFQDLCERRAFEVCFLPGHCHLAVVQSDCVSVYSLEGEFIRYVGESNACRCPNGITCSARGELVVADWGRHCVLIYNESGELCQTAGTGTFISVALHGDNLFGLTWSGCTVYM